MRKQPQNDHDPIISEAMRRLANRRKAVLGSRKCREIASKAGLASAAAGNKDDAAKAARRLRCQTAAKKRWDKARSATILAEPVILTASGKSAQNGTVSPNLLLLLGLGKTAETNAVLAQDSH